MEGGVRRAVAEALDHLVGRREVPLALGRRVQLSRARDHPAAAPVGIGRGDHGIDQHEPTEGVGRDGRSLGEGMAAHGVADADDVSQRKLASDGDQILAKHLPVRDRRLRAAPVAPLVHGEHVAAPEVPDDRIPAARVESRGMGQQQGRPVVAGAAPLEHRKLDVARLDAVLRRLRLARGAHGSKLSNAFW